MMISPPDRLSFRPQSADLISPFAVLLIDKAVIEIIRQREAGFRDKAGREGCHGYGGEARSPGHFFRQGKLLQVIFRTRFPPDLNFF